jgi:formylglycine-generating enzyme required for sulfatase activity
MAPAGAFCIDVTEVTNAQYLAFLGAVDGAVATLPPACNDNGGLAPRAPSGAWPVASAAQTLPVTYVTWCDAVAYCTWAGKRLCGAIGGGGSDPYDASSTESQWYYACSNGGHLGYPYGDAYAPTRCNGVDYSGGRPVDVGSVKSCVGGFPGVYDMSGNVEEWEYACRPGDAGCLNRGGSFGDSAGGLGCGAYSLNARDFVSDHTGFRCCSVGGPH